MSISKPPSAGMATLPTASPKATTMMAMRSPAITRDTRVRAPAVLFNEVPDTDPPTGMPWNTPDATLATPWPTKSRDASGYEPPSFGKFAEIPAP